MNFSYNSLNPYVRDVLNMPVFPNGEHHITLWMVVHLVALLALLFVATNQFKKLLIDKVLSKTKLDVGLRYAMGAVLSYVLLFVGLLVILDTAGIDITIVTAMLGALALGVSLSLQMLIGNCVSGLVILLERPIKVGDRVQVGQTVGEVTDISLRATSITTNENVTVIVPNSEFISQKVMNLSYNDKLVRLAMPISVDHDEEPEAIIKLLSETANSHPGIMKDRPVEVLFESFSKEAQNFSLLVWTQDYAHRPELLQSDLNRAISKALRERQMDMSIAPGSVVQTTFATAAHSDNISHSGRSGAR